MKFNKIVAYNIDRSKDLDDTSWKQIEKVTSQLIFIPKGDSTLKKELSDADGVLLNFATRFGKDEIDTTMSLKYIGILATAFGQVDTQYAKKKKIVVTNLNGYCTGSVSEFVFAALLDYLRNLDEGKKRVSEGNYSEIGISAIEIMDKKVGVIGLGSIGRRIAEISHGFGAQVSYWSRTRKKDAEKKGIQYLEMDDLLSSVDIISINLAHTKDTEKILNIHFFQTVKKDAIIINTASRELVDIAALGQMLQKNTFTYINDHPDEMSKEELEAFSHYKNWIVYPPIAKVSREAAEKKKRIFVENILSFLDGNPQNVINP